MIKFKKDFFWGGAVSAEQTEGDGITKKGDTIFATHWQKNPEDFYQKIGPNKAIDETIHYREDIELMAQLGFNSHRTSISWARLFPKGDYSKPNKEAVAFYHKFIDAFKRNNIELFLTLYHFDMPQYAQDKGGFESREVWEDFLKYCQFVLQEYGSKIKYWTTINEPWVPIMAGYVAGIQVPFKQDAQSAINAAYGVIMCHVKVVNYFNDVIKQQFPHNWIGGIFNSTVVYPKDQDNPGDVKAAKYYDLFQFSGLTDPCIGGFISEDMEAWLKAMNLYPQNFQANDLRAIQKVQLDFVGLNFYAPARAQAPQSAKAKNKFEEYYDPYNMPGRRENKFRGWEIFPEAAYDTLTIMKNKYPKVKNFMLTEYGMGVQNEGRFRNKEGFIEDNYRVAFIKEHLEQLHRFAIDNPDVNVMGAHTWATLDCWSWNNAFRNTYGLIEVDLKSQKRIPKLSAQFISTLAQDKGFAKNYKKMEEYMDFDKEKIDESVNF